MKYDTVIIVMVVFTICFLLFLAHDYQREGSFLNTVQASVGLKGESAGPRPEDTLVAPFAEEGVQPITNMDEYGNLSLPVNRIPLDKPHRNVRHVAQWVIQHVGNALILDKEKISDINTQVAPSFTEQALAQYKEFGKVTNIFSAVFHGDETTLAAYMKEDPLFIGPTTPGGIYHWTFEVPISISLVTGNLRNYQNTNAEQQLKDIFFCITVMRDNSANEDGLLIEKWVSGRCR